MEAVAQVRARQGLSLRKALAALGLSRATYHRYVKCSAPRPRAPRPRNPEPTPTERHFVCEHARAYPLMGYKRLTWSLQNDFIVGLRAHETAKILLAEGLMGPRLSVPLELKRPAEPDHPNQVWHIDLMYVRAFGRWLYLVDIIDAFSRFLVHWTLNETMEAWTVTLTVQEALERHPAAGKPAVVHDSGSQFLSKEWRAFAEHHGMPSIRTRIAHPESNGRVERLHRTHRTEALGGCGAWDIGQANAEMTKWADYYNSNRPHSALNGLPPIVYYLGDPEAALEQREHFVRAAAEARADYHRRNEGACQV